MKMMSKKWYGFYSLNKFKTDDSLKAFFKEALLLSSSFRINQKDDNYIRVESHDLSLNIVLDMASIKHHNFCIDRYLQDIHHGEGGEIGFCTMALDNDIFLYLHLSCDDLHALAKKHKLRKI